jgi:hypothetical protein
MPGTPGTPITAITATPAPNSDLPADVFPTVERITIVDRVGPLPGGANRQDTAHEKRTETLRTTVNLLVAAINVIDTDYLRRDGSAQADSTAGMEANLPMNGHILTGLGNGSVSTDSCAFGQLTAAIASLLGSANTWTGNNAFTTQLVAPTRALGDDSTNVATTAFVVQNSSLFIEANGPIGSTTLVTGPSTGCVAVISCIGGGGGGAADTDDATSGSSGGAIVNLPIRLAPGDTIVVTLGSGGGGGVGGTGANGGSSTVTINRAGLPALVITCGGGIGGTSSASPVGGVVTFQQYNSNVGFVATAFAAGQAGSSGLKATTGPHCQTSGGPSPFASGGIGSSTVGPILAINGTQGSGGGGGDAGSAGGNGYFCALITTNGL